MIHEDTQYSSFLKPNYIAEVSKQLPQNNIIKYFTNCIKERDSSMVFTTTKKWFIIFRNW